MPVGLGTLYGFLEASWKDEVLEDAAEECRDLFNTYRESLKEALSLRKLSSPERLQAYTMREPERWAAIDSMFPEEHQRQMKDFNNLRMSDRNSRIKKSSPTKEVERELSDLPLPGV